MGIGTDDESMNGVLREKIQLMSLPCKELFLYACGFSYPYIKHCTHNDSKKSALNKAQVSAMTSSMWIFALELEHEG